MGTFGGPDVVTDGIVLIQDAASARSYPGSGTVWKDLSGNSLNGTLSQSAMATTTSGEMILNRTSYSISYGNGTNALLKPASITVAAWVNLDNISNRHILITKWLGFSFEIGADGKPYFRLNNVGDATSSEAIDWGSWYYIVGTFDDSSKRHNVYINGVNRASEIQSSSIVTDNGSFNIPYLNDPVYAKGKIATLSIYNRELTSAEQLQNYNAQKNRYT